jgi:hypothetical protein
MALRTLESVHPFIERFRDQVVCTRARMKSSRQTARPLAGIGIGYLLRLTVVLVVLMVANAWIIGQAVYANLDHFPRVLHDVRLFQFFQVFGAFLLLGIQFWLWDRISERLEQGREAHSPRTLEGSGKRSALRR